MLGLLAAATLLCALAVASSASAVALRTGSATGTPLPVGGTVTGVNSGNVVLSGTFFGTPNTTTCTSSTIAATVRANATASGNVWLRIDNWTWSGCTSTASGACTVFMAGLSWDPATAGGDGGGLEVVSPTSMRLGMGTSTTNWWDWTDCMPNKSTCHLSGPTVGPATDTGFSLTNYAGGTWTNSASSAQLAIDTSLTVVSCPLTSTLWGAHYRFTTSGGQQVYLG